MFLHQSLNTQKFKTNKKLNLLKKGYITPGQFLALIQPNDPYIVLGSAIVDKDKQDQFISQWKNNIKEINILETKPTITTQEFIENLPLILSNFKETQETIKEFTTKLKSANCPICVKNRYLLIIANIIKKYFNDGREYSAKDKFIFEKILNKYFPFNSTNGKVSLDVNNYYDNTWIQPDSLVNIGYDLIEGLSNCFDCAKKHLSRAKAFYEELYLGYPEHIQLMFNEFTEANKDVQEAYTLYWDCLGQLDMSSTELIGQLIDIPQICRDDVIELANQIRTARINYQEDIKQIPNWDKLRINIQKLQNKFNKLKQNNK